MKKSLIALAVASAVSAPAFAATSNVDVYGKLHVSVSRIDVDTVGADNSTSVSSNASRIGFKGAEDLGGGLSAVWQYETTLNMDGNNAGSGGTGSMRNSFIGLKSGFGTVIAGIHDTPMKLLGRMVDNYGDTLADSRGMLGATSFDGKNIFDLRTNNTIAYVSPDFSGLTVTGAYVTDTNEATTNIIDNNNTDAYSVSGVYKNGPLMMGAAYEKQNVSATTDRNMWRLAAGYKFGNAKLGALYQSSESSAALTEERKGWGVFADYAMGAITLKANYQKAGDSKSVAEDGGKQFTLGADYALSKRTTVYALYAKVTNDTAAVYGLGTGVGSTDRVSGGGTAITGGTDPSLFSLGMMHSF